MLQILIVVVCVVISCFLIKKEAPAFVSVIVLITGVFISIYMLRIFSVITGYINVLINNIDIEKGYIKIVIKIIAEFFYRIDIGTDIFDIKRLLCLFYLT